MKKRILHSFRRRRAVMQIHHHVSILIAIRVSYDCLESIQIKENPMATSKKNTTNTNAKPAQASASKPFTAADLAKEVGLKDASLARRYLRAAKLKKPKDGWRWADKAAAKSAIEAVKSATKEALPKNPASTPGRTTVAAPSASR